MHEFAPILASLISSISRAGLNVVDRRQFKDNGICPVAISHWNNLFPVLMIMPMVLLSPASRLFVEIFFTLEIIFLSFLIQCVAHAFSMAFRSFRVSDIAVLSKIADITVPLILLLFGFQLIPYELFLLMPVAIALFIFCAGGGAVIRDCKAPLVLVFALTIQGVFAFFIGINPFLGIGIWGLLSTTCAMLLWRLIFSGLLLLFKGPKWAIYKFPQNSISCKKFYFRGLLTLITQISFVFAIESNNLMKVWPLLNATGLFSAVFASVFLSERLSVKDAVYVALSSCMGLILIFSSNNEKF